MMRIMILMIVTMTIGDYCDDDDYLLTMTLTHPEKASDAPRPQMRVVMAIVEASISRKDKVMNVCTARNQPEIRKSKNQQI